MTEITHIAYTWPSQQQAILYRASDGIRIGETQKAVCIYGDNPNKLQSRVFIDHQAAFKYLMENVAIEDMKSPEGIYFNVESPQRNIVEQCQEGSVILPADSLEMSTNGALMPNIMPFNRSLKN